MCTKMSSINWLHKREGTCWRDPCFRRTVQFVEGLSLERAAGVSIWHYYPSNKYYSDSAVATAPLSLSISYFDDNKMGNFQDQFENVRQDFSQHEERDRIANTFITQRHHSASRARSQASSNPPASSRVVDRELLHSTIIRRQNPLEKSVRLEKEATEESVSQANERLQELDLQFYHELALSDYQFKEIPSQFRREYQSLETVEQKDSHGIKYIGEWKDNMLHGNGVLISNTSKYIGQFKYGLKHFHGREIFKHQVYDGEFEAGRRKGQGVRYTPESTEMGIFNGHLIFGVISYINGNQYRGTLRHNKYHGKWISSQQELDSLFSDSYLKNSYRAWSLLHEDDAKGNTFYQAQSEIHYENAIFNSGSLQYARIFYPNGNVYQGQLKDNAKHGCGKFTWKDGSVYEGQYFMDEKHGKGTLATRGKVYRDKEFVNGTMKEEVETVYDDENSEMPSEWL